MSYLFRNTLHGARPIEDTPSLRPNPVARRMVVISTHSTGSPLEERLLALTLIELDNLEIGEQYSWKVNDHDTFIATSELSAEPISRSASTTHNQSPASLIGVSSWLATNHDDRLTFIGYGVSASAGLLHRELLNSNQPLPLYDVIDISSLAETFNLHPVDDSLGSLLEALSITDLVPGTPLSDSLAIAAATLAIAAMTDVDGNITDPQALFDKLATTATSLSAPRTGVMTPPADDRLSNSSGRSESDRPDSEKFSTTFLRVFFSLYLLMGLGLIALFPPFQSADAFAHFDRAVGISTGQIITSTVKNYSGSNLPASVLQAEVPFSKIPFNSVQRVDRAEFKVGFAQLWKSPASFTAYSTGAYLPFLYAPQVVGVWIGKMVSNHVLVSSYLAELMDLIAFVSLTMWALAQFPKRIALPLGAILLLPTVSSLATSVNPDALFIALSFVFAASCYNRYQDFRDGRTSRMPPRHSRTTRNALLRRSVGHVSTRYHFAYISLFFMVVEKPPYIVLALLLPIADFYSDIRRYVAKVSLFVATSLLVYGVWTLFGAHGQGGPTVGFPPSPVRQGEYLLTHPFAFVKVLFETFRWGGWAYIQEYLAGIGWLDVRFPNWFYEGLTLTIFVLFASTAVRRRDNRWRFLGTLLVPLMAAMAILLSFYIFYSPYQWPLIDGFQGRYLIPLVPIFIVLIGMDRERSSRLRIIADTAVNNADVILVSLEILIACEFFMMLLTRYWN